MDSIKMQGLDLFSGIGGISKALEPWTRTIAYCEQDKFCQSVLLSRMETSDIDEAPIWDDVTTLDKPCLDMLLSYQKEADSMAGKLKKMTEEQVVEAIESYKDGMSLQDIAHIYFVTRQAIWGLFKARNVEMRPQKRYGEDNHFYRGGRSADDNAQNILEKAVEHGELSNPGQCELCGCTGRFADGRTAIQGHHTDYNRPLDVMWLCQKCHHEWHKQHKPIKKESHGSHGGDAIDIIFGGFP